jgi:hypothetical protein
MKSLPNKSQINIGIVLAAFLCLFSINSAKAQLLNFDFTIDGNATYSNIGGGTVTGEIIGVQNNAASIPLNIIITSAPSGLTLSLPYSLEAQGWNFSENTGDTITVNNGAITSATAYEASLISTDSYLDLNFHRR